MMYHPIQPGIPKALRDSVNYEEFPPTASFEDVVYCFWRLNTKGRLEANFDYLVLPDGCVDVLFDLGESPDFEGALVMTPSIRAEKLSLGKSFSYVGIRFWPGVWQDCAQDIVGNLREIDGLRGYSFRDVRKQLIASDDAVVKMVLENLVKALSQLKVVKNNPLTEILLDNSASSVEYYIQTTNYSRRQLQRIIKDQLGYSPHDFIKILRFQEALQSKTFDKYADQSHFIRECKRITGLTPQELYSMYW
jgi:AraC-like DNA-binding protein